MENNEWDESLKNLLGDHTPEGAKPDWDAFSDYLHEHEYLEELSEDADFDENLRESLTTFDAPAEKAAAWERIEATLDADPVFDASVRNRISQFEPQYDPRTWPLLLSRLSGIGYLRTKLIAFKVVEVAAVFLLLFTVLKMGQLGKLPFETPLYEKQNQELPATPQDRAQLPDAESTESVASISNANGENSFSENQTSENTSSENKSLENTEGTVNHKSFAQSSPSTASVDAAINQKAEIYKAKSLQNSKTNSPIATVTAKTANNLYQPNYRNSVPTLNTLDQKIEPLYNPESNESAKEIISITPSSNDHFAATDHKKGQSIIDESYTKEIVESANFLATLTSPIHWVRKQFSPKPKYIKQRAKTYTEFGIVSQMDYNRMRMPEDRLYSAGRQIVFPQQGIPSSSMGGGFTLGIGHPRWAVESGIIYSAKNFKPGRQLIVGGAFDNGSVEFEAMRLQLVTVPLQFRYRVDNKGLFRFYALSGLGLNLITQSDIDVLIKYHFPSLGFGENPNNDPALAQTIRETKRISEHIRDGAPLSTKSFLSLSAGLGAEYALRGHKTLFLQSSIQYQVPNLKFSNNNGKHIRTVSIQAGVRTPFGK